MKDIDHLRILNDTEYAREVYPDKEYYTTEDIVIPAGTMFQNWSNEKKRDGGRFDAVFGVGPDIALYLNLTRSDIEEIKIHAPHFLTEVPPNGEGIVNQLEDIVNGKAK